MILPDKYTTNSESLIVLSAFILDVLGHKKEPPEKLWQNFKRKYMKRTVSNYFPTYYKFILTLNLMFIIGIINYDEEGNIYNENFKIKNTQ
ncbi:ABC-three component system middle component 6 [Bacillus wiedmannii]|uniref:ABC-three component system middle component 6 n=1 Tax=Bacillus wiedmannii TaxID=1890302 RepID=UPI00399CACD5